MGRMTESEEEAKMFLERLGYKNIKFHGLTYDFTANFAGVSSFIEAKKENGGLNARQISFMYERFKRYKSSIFLCYTTNDGKCLLFELVAVGDQEKIYDNRLKMYMKIRVLKKKLKRRLEEVMKSSEALAMIAELKDKHKLIWATSQGEYTIYCPYLRKIVEMVRKDESKN